MARILLVEDSPEIQKIVLALFGQDLTVVCATSAAEALEKIQGQKFDLILLDIILPDGNGFEICATIRSVADTRDTPVIFLTGRTGVNEKVVGFSLGADDYVTKPFDPIELKARVNARLARAQIQRHGATHFRKGDLTFQIDSQTVAISAQGQEAPITLTALEFRLLLYFARHEEILLNRNQLLENVWGDTVHVIDRTVDGHISSVRRKIRNSQYTIKSVYGAGYLFIRRETEELAPPGEKPGRPKKSAA